MQTDTRAMTNLTALCRLIRLPLSAMVAVSALAGALTAAPYSFWLKFWAIVWGIFLLSSACSVLNQVQERFTDALMRRTCRRPLACGELSPATGMTIGLLLATGGVAVLLTTGSALGAVLGLLATVWYLAVYTPLKRISSLAVVAGTPCGALPPLIGWIAAGGDPLDPRPLVLVLLMVLWQVPHYWLLAMPDRDELARTGFKVLPAKLTAHQLLHISHFWILGMISATLLLPLMHVVQLPLLQGLIAGLAIVFAIWSTRVQRKSLFVDKSAHILRIGLHIYLALILGTILIDGIFLRLTF
ncbi:MAG: protoheme IX farnesyltransferase [Gammaproteobacteria bacterium]|nr:protoheme IX farnesyltransferase [Gammaproteobacteria bacterium]